MASSVCACARPREPSATMIGLRIGALRAGRGVTCSSIQAARSGVMWDLACLPLLMSAPCPYCEQMSTRGSNPAVAPTWPQFGQTIRVSPVTSNSHVSRSSSAVFQNQGGPFAHVACYVCCRSICRSDDGVTHKFLPAGLGVRPEKRERLPDSRDRLERRNVLNQLH
jgi:hypothetical protein